MGILSCLPLTSVESPVDVFLSSSVRLFTLRSELYLVGSGDFPNKRATNPIGVYKVGMVSLLYEGFIFHQSWLETLNYSFGVFCPSYESVMPIYSYLDLFNTSVGQYGCGVSKNVTPNTLYSEDTGGIIFAQAFNFPPPGEDSVPGNPSRMISKVKPALLGWIKPCDSVIITNISSNCQIDLNIDGLR